MIEVRVDEDAKPVTADGPHDHESTRAIASGIDEAFRLLNYATMSRDGLAYPSDVYNVLGSLSAALAKMPQALHQVIVWHGQQVASGAVRKNRHYGRHGGDAQAAHTEMVELLVEAANIASRLSDRLGEAQSAVRGLESAGG